MEHLLVHLVLETIHSLDRKLQRPLGKVIPDYSTFKADPPRYLADNSVTFGPRRRHVLAIVIGLGAAIGVTLLLMLAFRHMPKPLKQDEWVRWAGVCISFVVVAYVARTIALRLMPGGSLTLTKQGATLTYGDQILFLPWDVLQASGGVFEPDHKLVVLPINPNVPVALTNAEGEVTAMLPEELELPQAECSDYCQLALKDLYEVRIGDVGELLRDLGLRLGSADMMGIDAVVTSMVAPLAVVDEKGWVRIQLTQLPFPPLCAGCGETTSEELDVRLLTTANRSFTLPVPFCQNCAQVRNRKRWIAAWIGIGIGVVFGVATAASIIHAVMDPLFLIVALAIGLPVAVFLGALFYTVSINRNTPFRWKDYKPDKGTVKMRFRHPEKSEPLLTALGIPISALIQKPRSPKPEPL